MVYECQPFTTSQSGLINRVHTADAATGWLHLMILRNQPQQRNEPLKGVMQS